MTRYKALQDKIIVVGNRQIDCKVGEKYELSDEEMKRIPSGYFENEEKKGKKAKEGE